MKITKHIVNVGICLFAVAAIFAFAPKSSAAKKMYSVTPSSKAKIQTYLNKLEKKGGTLVFKKGTYKLSNVIYVPSKVTIKLSDKTKLVKTGSKAYMFALVSQKKATKSNVYKGYKGASKINIVGEGNATIDLNKQSGRSAIIVTHNDKVTISGITFKNAYKGRYIRLSGSSNVTFTNNTFTSQKRVKKGTMGAINIECLDSKVNSAVYVWAKKDKTPCKNISITNNTFSSLERGIGSVGFTKNKFIKKMNITGNTFTNISTDAIRLIQVEKLVVKNNTVTNITDGNGMQLSGVKYPVITDNTFKRMNTCITFSVYKNSGAGKAYGKTVNKLSSANKKALQNNHLDDMKEYVIRYYTSKLVKWPMIDMTDRNLVISENSKPYRNYYVKYPNYNAKTRQVFCIRACIDQLERTGGGTITFKKGEYNIWSSLFIPSNVTLIFEDGVVLNDTLDTGGTGSGSSVMFEAVAWSKHNNKGIFSGYNGEKNIKFIGKGNVVFNLRYLEKGFAMRIAHVQNIEIENITFKNLNMGHFIELDASKNVSIKNCKFIGNKEGATKCAINLDTPDKLTGGYSSTWTSFCKTPNLNVNISNCTFTNQYRAIDTHRFSQGKYHENVTITNNVFNQSVASPIMMLNWKNAKITNNKFNGVSGEGSINSNNDDSTDRFAVFGRGGVINPTISGNTVQNVYMLFYAKAQIPLGKTVGVYSKTESSFTQASLDSIKNNTLSSGVIENYFMIAKDGYEFITYLLSQTDLYYIN